MSLTVRALVSQPHLRLEVLCEGDLDRVIRWVHSSDMPDPAPYLRGGEVVLTAGIWHWSGTAAGSFAGSLDRAGAAALGFGTTALVSDVPRDLVAACRARHLTLFHVPDGIAFIEIAEAFFEAQARERERPLLDSLERSEQLLRTLQLGRGLDGLLVTLRRLLQREVGIVGRGRQLGTAAGGVLPEDAIRRAHEAIEGGEPVNLPGYAAFAIPTGAREAVLLVAGTLEELAVSERAAVNEGLAFLAVELQRARAVSESERRFAAELFDLVDAGDAQLPAVGARLRAFGLDPDLPLVALCCESPDLEAALAAIRAHFDGEGRRGAAAVKGAQLVGVVHVDRGEDLDLVAAELHATVGDPAFVGVGSVAENAHGIRRSVVEARHACRFAQKRRDAGHATHDALASHSLLLAIQDEHVLTAFHDTLIRPLEEHDARRHTELVKTLDAFLGSGGRYQSTADALHLHVNTLRLRLARIEAIVERDLGSMDDRVDLWIALQTRRGASG